ncbi:MAG: hypothetical protein WBN64_00400 [Candidatus Deferrimicrobium sp.]
MEEEKEKQGLTETDVPEDLITVKGRRGPTWRGWVLSILVAVILSVTATLLLGGYVAFRSDRTIGAGMGSGDSWGGRSCCPPADAGK